MNEFYNQCYVLLKNSGFQVIPEDKLIPVKLSGVTVGNGKKLDCVLLKDGETILTEIKSPKECKDIQSTAHIDIEEDKKTNNWAGKLISYHNHLKKLNYDLKETAHLIHIYKTELITEMVKQKGYFETKDKTRHLATKLYLGYIVPVDDSYTVKEALDKAKKSYKLYCIQPIATLFKIET